MILKLTESAFESFYIGTTPLSLGIDLNVFYRVLKLMKSDDKLRLLCVSSIPRKLELNIINSEGRMYASFSLRLISVDDCIPEDQFKYNSCHITVPSSLFERLIQTTLPFGDGLRIIASGTSAIFVANSKVGESVIEVSDDDENTNIVVNNPTHMYFAAKRLHTIALCSKNLSDSCTISLADNLPVRIDFRFKAEKGYLRFFLVPMFDGAAIDFDD